MRAIVQDWLCLEHLGKGDDLERLVVMPMDNHHCSLALVGMGIVENLGCGGNDLR